MAELKYLVGYPDSVIDQVNNLIASNTLGNYLLKKFPFAHEINNDKALYAYTVELKNQFIRQSKPLSKVVYDDKLDVLHQALGLHSFVSRVQGNKLKAKNEIRIGSVFKQAPVAILKMIVVHELAHIKEKEHNKAFYKLCEYMEPDYHQLEFDCRLYLTHLEQLGKLD